MLVLVMGFGYCDCNLCMLVDWKSLVRSLQNNKSMVQPDDVDNQSYEMELWDVVYPSSFPCCMPPYITGNYFIDMVKKNARL